MNKNLRGPLIIRYFSSRPKAPLIFIFTFLCFFLLGSFSPAGAHGGHNKKKTETEDTGPTDSMYIVEGNGIPMSESEEQAPDDLFSPRDLFTEGEIASPEMENMDHGAMDPDQHKEVKLATHEWISPSSKGYGIAVGLTLLSGLIFGFLTFKRPNE